MNNIAIYARYSSDLQSDRSIEDQVRLCREYLSRSGRSAAVVYEDRATSGAHMMTRPGIMRLMQDAGDRKITCVIAEDLSRLSRDLEDIAAMYKRLGFLDIAMETVSEGPVTMMHIGLKGTMNTIFLSDLRDKIRRGQRGRVEDGLCAAGLSYGYDVVRKHDARGEPIRGLRKINEAQAEVIRRIYREYSSGRSARAIAADLNRDGIPSPRGTTWGASTINGNPARGYGILYNEAYAGFLVYDRVRMVKNPATGKRLNRPNPPDKWKIVEAPDLRIIDQDLWDKVQVIKNHYSGLKVKKPTELRRPKRLLSGLLRCASCGAAYVIKQKDRYACTTHTQKGCCTNNTTVLAQEVEGRVIDALRSQLAEPEAVTKFIETYNARMGEMRREQGRARIGLEKEREQTQRAIDNLLKAVKDGLYNSSIKEEMTRLERRRHDLDAQLGMKPAANIIDLHPAAGKVYEDKIRAMAVILRDPGRLLDAQNLLSALVEQVVIFPRDSKGAVRVEIHGALAGFMALATQDNLPTGKVIRQITVQMVAEEGFEPPTQGL